MPAPLLQSGTQQSSAIGKMALLRAANKNKPGSPFVCARGSCSPAARGTDPPRPHSSVHRDANFPSPLPKQRENFVFVLEADPLLTGNSACGKTKAKRTALPRPQLRNGAFSPPGEAAGCAHTCAGEGETRPAVCAAEEPISPSSPKVNADQVIPAPKSRPTAELF